MPSPPNPEADTFTPFPFQHEAAKLRSPNPEAASFVPRRAQPQSASHQHDSSQVAQPLQTTQPTVPPSSSQPNARQDSATAHLHASIPDPVAPARAVASMTPIATPFFMPDPLNAALEQSGISAAILCNRLQAVERTLLRIEQAIGQRNTGTTNASSWASVVRAEDRLIDVERAVARLGTTLGSMEGILEDTIASNREDLKTVIAVAVGTVLESVDALHNEEKARLQERGNRYARKNHILREQLRCKTARVKQGTRQNTAKMAKLAEESSDALSPIPKKRTPSVLRDSAVDMADESAGSAESDARITIGLHKVGESARQVGETTPLGQENDPGFDLGFLDSVDTSETSNMRYLHHFMPQDQRGGAPTEVAQDGHISSGEAGFAYHMSAAPSFSSRPPEVLKTGLDVSRATFSSACAAPRIVAVAPTLTPPQPVTWDGSIHWVGPGPFATLAERQEAGKVEQFNPRYGLKPIILVEGLRYQPGLYATDVYRTVVISNLPATILTGALLRQIRGGNVYSVSIMDTSSILGSSSAFVTFILERSAASFVQMAAVKPIIFGGKQAKVRLVKTPTYPMNRILERGIFERGYTRVVVIKNIHNPVLMEGIVKDVVALQMTENVVSWSAKEGDLAINFTSVAAANMAYEFIAQSPVHTELDLHWGKDPCDRQ